MMPRVGKSGPDVYKRQLFVPGALPGERCLVRVVSIGKTTAHGKLLRVEAASPHRIEPDCPYFPACGGCDFRHADYVNYALMQLIG